MATPWRSRLWVQVLFFSALILLTRQPLAFPTLFSFDDVNLVYALGDFDIRKSQPHPPGYPLFVAQMKALEWLRVRNPHSILWALSLIGSILPLVLLARAGDRLLGRDVGLSAAILLAFNAPFWYAALTSALRLQLALVSIVVAAACYRAWRGERRWIFWSALALGLGAGIRPELGPLLLPLWVGSALSAPERWVGKLAALGLMAMAVLVWLVPTAWQSGGLVEYFRACAVYLADQSSVRSGLFGAAAANWREMTMWLVAWIFPTVLAWPLLFSIGRGMDKVPRKLVAFWGLWIGPPLLFGALVHVADAGQVLAIVPGIVVATAYLAARAADAVRGAVSPWLSGIGMALVLIPLGVMALYSGIAALGLVALLGWAAGVWLRRQSSTAAARGSLLAVLLAPAVMVNGMVFFHDVWQYPRPAGPGLASLPGHLLADLHRGLLATSLWQVRYTLRADGSTIAEVRRLAAERPDRTVVIWRDAKVSWRKLSFYMPETPVMLLDRKTLEPGADPVVHVRRGPVLERQMEGEAPLRVEVPKGSRLIWLVEPEVVVADSGCDIERIGGIAYCDLRADASGRVALGPFTVAW